MNVTEKKVVRYSIWVAVKPATDDEEAHALSSNYETELDGKVSLNTLNNENPGLGFEEYELVEFIAEVEA